MKTSLDSIIKIFSIMAVVTAAFSCSSGGDGRPVLVVSIEPQRYLLESIVGDRFKVVSMMPDHGNVEAYEPSVTSRAALDESHIYFTVGSLPFEINLIMAADEDLKVVCTTVNIEPIYGTHGHAHSAFLGEHADSNHLVDPHYWVSVRNMRNMACIMAREVKALDPENEAEYNARYVALDSRLDSLDRAFTASLDNAAGSAFLMWHPSLSYFARDYDLHQIAVSGDNKEVTINNMRNTIQEAIDHKVKVFFNEGYCNPEQARTLVDAVDARSVDINMLGYDWEDQITKIADELSGI